MFDVLGPDLMCKMLDVRNDDVSIRGVAEINDTKHRIVHSQVDQPSMMVKLLQQLADLLYLAEGDVC